MGSNMHLHHIKSWEYNFAIFLVNVYHVTLYYSSDLYIFSCCVKSMHATMLSSVPNGRWSNRKVHSVTFFMTINGFLYQFLAEYNCFPATEMLLKGIIFVQDHDSLLMIAPTTICFVNEGQVMKISGNLGRIMLTMRTWMRRRRMVQKWRGK